MEARDRLQYEIRQSYTRSAIAFLERLAPADRALVAGSVAGAIDRGDDDGVFHGAGALRRDHVQHVRPDVVLRLEPERVGGRVDAREHEVRPVAGVHPRCPHDERLAVQDPQHHPFA